MRVSATFLPCSTPLRIIHYKTQKAGILTPDTIQEIRQSCTTNFDIQFPQFDKIDANVTIESALFTYLKYEKVSPVTTSTVN
ncbi:MAG: hypothetical protein K6E67_09950 [Prevotella sp.]|nr:hypothetical protein [Prevotella sp.]